MLYLGIFLAVSAAGMTAASQWGSDTKASATGDGRTVWLCRPGARNDPCALPRGATDVEPSGATSRQAAPATAQAGDFDCFYAYPTASDEAPRNADLTIQLPELTTAEAQASRFSQVCRVFAPMYRQVTVNGLRATTGLRIPAGEDDIAYDSLAAGFATYLSDYNDGRPFVLIGHSQGAAMLIRLIRSEIDDDPALRARMVLAILPGGNVEVGPGGSFQHIPTCSRAGADGCVIAYSTFPTEPPPGTLFGRAGQGVSHLWGGAGGSGVEVACTDPADLSDPQAPADLEPYFLSPSLKKGQSSWLTYTHLYRAQCESRAGVTWLQVTTVPGTPDRHPLDEPYGDVWGYHVDDVNLALGNLVADVAAAERTWAATHG